LSKEKAVLLGVGGRGTLSSQKKGGVTTDTDTGRVARGKKKMDSKRRDAKCRGKGNVVLRRSEENRFRKGRESRRDWNTVIKKICLKKEREKKGGTLVGIVFSNGKNLKAKKKNSTLWVRAKSSLGEVGFLE